MKIAVISLRSAGGRRQSIVRQFERFATEFDFFDAVEPPQALDHIERYDETEFVANCGRGATDTEIACFASHLALWRQCAAGDEPYLILEDDAQLADSFLAGILVTRCQVRRLGLIRVSLPALTTSTVIKRFGAFDIHYCQRAPLLALGYAISPEVAKQLVSAGKVVEEPVDKFLQRFWRFGRPVFAIVPPFIGHSAHANDSNIGLRLKRRIDLRTRVKRTGRKARNAVSRTIYNANFLSDPRACLAKMQHTTK